MSSSSNNSISKNIIQNHTYNGIGMYDSSDRNLIIHNIININKYCGINLAISSNNEIIENSINDNNIGIRISNPQYKNNIVNNDFSNNKNDYIQEAGFPLFEFIIVAISLVFMTIFIVFWREGKEKKIHISTETKHTLDARGNPCPIPLIMTKKKLNKMTKGEILEITTADIVAKENIESYAVDKYELIRIDKKGGDFKIFIKK
jgi:tRNA 2-thiouridine synthesizing protein A